MAGIRPADPAPQTPPPWAVTALAMPDDPAWCLEVQCYQPAREPDVESRCAIGNGLLGVRGSLEQPAPASNPRTFIAGLFDTPPGETAVPGLVPGPDWLRLHVVVGGEPLALDAGETLEHVRTLDFRRGVLVREWRWRDPRGRIVRLRTLRFASLADRALAAQFAHVEVEQPAPLTLEAWLEPPGAGLVHVRADGELTIWRTAHAARWLAVANSATVRLGRRVLRSKTNGGGAQRWNWLARPARSASLARVIGVARGESAEHAGDEALAALRRARAVGPSRLLAAHTRAWADRWAASDVEVAGDDRAQQALRFAIYHLVSAANPEDERVSIGARALTGSVYNGHVFWDTEIFLLPFYTFTWPAAARALLLYRFHTLPAARAKAARMGYRGALYAWESAGSGAEATPPYAITSSGQVVVFRSATEEQHISADVAYAIWQYWQATDDVAFLLDAGAEIILETARFWASRAALEADGRYHIRGVIGPDEYHEGIDDNAYTNGLARWNLEWGLEVTDLLRARWPARWAGLRERLDLSTDELAAWHDVAGRLVTGPDARSGLFEQFAGFFDLEPIDLAAYALRTVPMDVLLGRERTQQSQVVKQADVVMLLALLWDRYSPAVRETNFRYYEPRCGHGSSLSPATHALVAARLGDVDLAEHYFRQAAAIDLDNTMGNTAGGVHIATLGGLWQAAVLGFGGLSLAANGLRLDPHLPRAWHALRFPVQWRGRLARIELGQEPPSLTATLERGGSLRLEVGDLGHDLRAGEVWRCAWDGRERCWREVPG